MKIEQVSFSMKVVYFYLILRGLSIPTGAGNIINLRHNFAAAYFVQHKNCVLDIEGINSFLVAFATECALRCAQHESCLSFNIGVKRRKDGGSVPCKILPATALTAMQKLKESKNFHHWSISDPCSSFPCRNGGTCVRDHRLSGLFRCACRVGYEGEHCQDNAVPLGSFGNPGISCKDIAERKSYPLEDGKYWIKPTGSEQFSVYCDMTTDGGGWTLIKRFIFSPALINAKEGEFTRSKNYNSISNYSNNFLFATRHAVRKLREDINFHQLRWYCHKKTKGSVFHVLTKNNSAGHKVLKYFLQSVKVHAEACDSFIKLPDDNSTLSRNCQKWGHNGTATEVNQWGYFNNKGPMNSYRNVTVWINGGKAFSLNPPSIYWCDDQAGMSSLTEGDTWELYCR